MERVCRKAKKALGAGLCVHLPSVAGDREDGASERRASDALSLDSAAAAAHASAPNTPAATDTAEAGALRRSKSGGKSSKRMCAICFDSMKPGHGQALFTAECSHMFHFHCISSNVKHGNHVCPVCRTKWKEIPFNLSLSSIVPRRRGGLNVNQARLPQQDAYMGLLRQVLNRQREAPVLHTSEPVEFNDDEPLQKMEAADSCDVGSSRTVEIKTYPEFSAIPQSSSQDDFAVLIHLKAPYANPEQVTGGLVNATSIGCPTSHAPVDLVTVLDVSGSMAGTKLALLKRAMGFVIQHLGPLDRLSVIAFSSTAIRLFHLRRMSHSGQQQALQAVNSLGAGGGTNIADALKKAAKVIEDRNYQNPVCSIILLSDGQDTYNIASNVRGARPDYRSLVPSSILNHTFRLVPVHGFGFGVDHDSDALHSIAEASGGTFSFIEDEGAIQDAFAQCIGGLLSVAVQDMQLNVECVHPGVQLRSIKSGSYLSKVAGNGRNGSIDVGHLYADEKRDFLLSVSLPHCREQTTLLKVACTYRDPLTIEAIRIQGDVVKILRSKLPTSEPVCMEVDRARNRVRAADAIEAARAAAERGTLSDAVAILEDCRRILSESFSSRSGDRLCTALDAELREMQERMANRQRYEASGRAYLLSGLSSHSWQRATARGDSTDSATLVYSYQTPSMVQMLQRSQNHYPSPQGPSQVQQPRFFLGKPQPR
ncbi:E3 ubiquitin-protein ligase WAV3-like [Phragmites australis]|uniref:E3 ubiquitin-protein ligase WAV3-like n=1 Tax=Phragmites australis TaxID=29695 RepID=UPI002D77515E|nr:E3 ubiquitin-protein ligase WAV3-like [Phragmites australis]